MIDSTVIRLMKARKTLLFKVLVNCIIEEIRMFRADDKFIKKRIEILIERGFLRRGGENDKLLIYIP